MAKDKTPTNTPTKGAPKRDDKGRWEKGTPPPNPSGRPKDGESWAAVIREISEMSADEVFKLVGVTDGEVNDLGKAFKQMPPSVAMKKLVVARILATLMFEPTGTLWKELMERVDGKVPQQVDLTNLDVTALTLEQLQRLRDGEDVISILANPS